MSKTTYYINGNAVREIGQPQPQRRPQKTRRELEEARRRKNRRNAARRNRAAFSLIRIRSNVTQQMKEVAALESRLEDTRADNDAKYKQITTSVDLNHIRDVAINQLGMKYASSDQIVYYTVDNSNYMDQYNDIP